MIRVLHKYKKVVFWGLVILVVPSFVLWGGYQGSSGNQTAEQQAALAGAVATVGGAVVTGADFRRALNDEADRRSKYGGERPTDEQMVEDGTANRVMDQMVEAAVVQALDLQRDVKCDRDFLVDQLKDQMFKTEDGQFDGARWNDFIDSDPLRDWNVVYASMDEQVSRQVFLETIKAPGRVLDKDLAAKFDENYSTLKIKYVKIEPEVVPTAEEIQAQFDEDPRKYDIPEKRVAEYAAVSMKPPKPDLVDELVKRARDGEDFAELAKQYSDGMDKDTGGDVGWLIIGDRLPEHRKAVADLAVGQVSDPVEALNGYFIYKAEEERTNEETKEREVKTRNIYIAPKLSDEERESRKQQADDLLAAAVESGDLAAAATAASLEVKTTGSFSVESTEIENMPKMDLYSFRMGFKDVAQGAFAEVIEGRENLYVAKVVSVEPAVPQPLEAVRERVEKDTIQKIKASDAYAAKIDGLARDIMEKAKSLADIQTMFPELKVQIEEPAEFTVKKSPYIQGAQFQSSIVYQMFKGKEPGAFGGPIKGFQAPQFFVELVSLTPPNETEWTPEKREEEMKTMRESDLTMAQNKRMMDFIKFTKARMAVEYDAARFAEITGANQAEEEPAPETPPADAPVE